MACPKSGHVPSILRGHVPRAGMSQAFLTGMSQERARPKHLKGMCQERAFPNEFQGHVPRAGLSQTFKKRAGPKRGHVPTNPIQSKSNPNLIQIQSKSDDPVQSNPILSQSYPIQTQPKSNPTEIESNPVKSKT